MPASLYHPYVLYPSESDRKAATRKHLQDAIGHGIQHVVNFDLTAADGRATVVARRGDVSRNVLTMIDEEKRDSADSGIPMPPTDERPKPRPVKRGVNKAPDTTVPGLDTPMSTIPEEDAESNTDGKDKKVEMASGESDDEVSAYLTHYKLTQIIDRDRSRLWRSR
jgi:hypothetical protein